MRNENLRFQRLLDDSQTQVERTARQRDVATRERDTAQGERDIAILAYNNEKQESRRWMFSYRDKDRRVQGLLRENLLNSYCISEILTVFSKIPDSCRLMLKTK